MDPDQVGSWLIWICSVLKKKDKPRFSMKVVTIHWLLCTVDSKIHENFCQKKIWTNSGNGYFIQVYIIYCCIIYTIIDLFLWKLAYSYYHASLNQLLVFTCISDFKKLWNASHIYACRHPKPKIYGYGWNVQLRHLTWPKRPWPKCPGRNVLGRNVRGRNVREPFLLIEA